MGTSIRTRALAGCLVAALLAACSGQGGAQQFLSLFSQPCGPKLVYWQPVWSPDGQDLAFYSDHAESRLYVITASGRNLLVQDIDSRNSIDRPAWSPDGTQLAITLHHRLAVIHRDGTGLRQLVDASNSETDSLPMWSPDGRQILFVSLDQNGHTTINLINADGSERKQIAHSNTNTWVWPSWSPDGTRIMFKLVDDTGLESVAVVNRDGSGLTSLTPPAQYYQGAAWSPDGKRIAYAFSTQVNPSHIFLMNSDGTHVVQLTTYTWDGAAGPVWSPDGKQIAFSVSGDHAQPTLFVMTGDGQDIAPLPAGLAGEFSWSLDSTQLAYSGSGSSEVYLVDASGSNIRQLTQNPGNQSCFRWPF